MTRPANETDLLLNRLVERHGRLFSEELGLDLTLNTPSVLFRWVCAALRMSARISHGLALEAARALSDASWTTAERMAESTWVDRVEALNAAGYARYDQRTASMPGDTACLLCDRYDGDFRNLRAASARDPQGQRTALNALKGIRNVGAAIFLRDLQTVWSEHFPLMDQPASKAAQRFGLPETAGASAEGVAPGRFVRIVTALVKVELEGVDRADLLEDAERSSP